MLWGLESCADILAELDSPSPAACFIWLITREPKPGSRTGREGTTVQRWSPTRVESCSNYNQSRCSSQLGCTRATLACLPLCWCALQTKPLHPKMQQFHPRNDVILIQHISWVSCDSTWTIGLCLQVQDLINMLTITIHLAALSPQTWCLLMISNFLLLNWGSEVTRDGGQTPDRPVFTHSL